MRSTNIFVSCMLVFMLSGCGQTGPLYLPNQQPPQKPSSIEKLGLG